MKRIQRNKARSPLEPLCRAVKRPGPHVFGLLLYLWTDALRRPPGSAIGSIADVEVASGWNGSPGAWAAALVKNRWITIDDRGSLRFTKSGEGLLRAVSEKLAGRSEA